MIREILNPFEDAGCFFCGHDNPDGLKLTFFHDTDAGEVFTEYDPPSMFQGQGNIFHGGMQMGLLDEAMWWAGYAETGILHAVTSSVRFKFLRPVYLGTTIKVLCRVKAHDERTIHLAGRILNVTGDVCTAATGQYRILDKTQYARAVAGTGPGGQAG